MTMRLHRRKITANTMRNHTKRGPGRCHRSGPVRSTIAALPEFGADKKGNVIRSLPLKYMHSLARRMDGGWDTHP